MDTVQSRVARETNELFLTEDNYVYAGYPKEKRIYLDAKKQSVEQEEMEKEEEDRLIRPHRWITTIPQLRTHMSTIVVEDLRSKPVAQQELDKSNHNSNKRSRKSIKSKLQKNAEQMQLRFKHMMPIQ